MPGGPGRTGVAFAGQSHKEPRAHCMSGRPASHRGCDTSQGSDFMTMEPTVKHYLPKVSLTHGNSRFKVSCQLWLPAGGMPVLCKVLPLSACAACFGPLGMHAHAADANVMVS